jgi:hypothetical protein
MLFTYNESPLGGHYKPWNSPPACAAALPCLCLDAQPGSLSSAPAPPPASLRFFTLALALRGLLLRNPFAAAAQPCLQLAHSTARIGLVLQGECRRSPPLVVMVVSSLRIVMATLFL